MKKLFLGLAMSAGTLSFAQEQTASSTSPVRFGIKAGLNGIKHKSWGLSKNLR
ncbi:hypothetical protein [uncultured Chryseobacterium sp.]|uniref:hypothetical protein n=1 Tax=uncultured Chryseobacterium sp. TaxID=259322 RepID=UPI0025F11AD1|nr:hypothetical protein [uncultured Chryseobacterium sp.]